MNTTSDKYRLAALLGRCEREFRNDMPLLHAIRAAIAAELRGLA